MRNHQTTEALKRILAEPHLQPSSVVASASRELALRVQNEGGMFERKVRISATAAAIVGGFCVVWPLLILSLVPSPPEQTLSRDSPFVFRHFNALFFYVGIFQAVVGALLLSGGLLTRRRKPTGRWLILAALFLALAYVVLSSASFIEAAFSFRAPWPFALFFVAASLGSAALFGFLLWLPTRFFLSPRVREHCRATAA